MGSSIRVLKFIFLMMCTTISDDVFGQQKIEPHPFVPITRYSKGRYPKQIEVKGKIVDLTVGTSCGVVCGCGTIKIALELKIKKYKFDTVYAAIPCFNVNYNDYINKTINIKLKLLKENNKDCYWNEAPFNYIDSRGIPFYIPNNESEKLNIN